MVGAMESRMVRTVSFTLPELDPEDLVEVAEPPEDGRLVEAFVDGGQWAGWEADDDIRRCRLVGTALTDAMLLATTIYGCSFERVDLSGSRWRDVTLERTVFKGCRLLGAHLTNVSTKDVIFEDCRLDYATLDRLRTAGPTAFIDCTFAEATATRTALPQAILDGCRLAGTELIECDLRDTDLRGSDLSTIIGLPSLVGARVTPDQLGELLHPLVQHFRLQVSPLEAGR
jgi:uncharacterized protein YjbI with pentapeptide repeats